MKNSEFRTPLLQSGAILLAIVFIISLIPSGDGMGLGTALGALFTGIFKLCLFVFGIFIAIALAIAVLIGIFIAGVALYSPETAADIWAATKVRLASVIHDTVACKCNESACAVEAVEDIATDDIGITQEELDQMKSTISSLESTNSQLQNDVTDLRGKNAQLQEDIHSLTTMVDELKESEAKINELIDELSANVEQDPSEELKEQIKQLEGMAHKTTDSLADIASRLEALEDAITIPGEEMQAGIFAYFETDADCAVFINKVKEGVSKDLTYAQFDEFLTQELSAKLDKIVKDHPSLTKDYIRTMRK